MIYYAHIRNGVVVTLSQSEVYDELWLSLVTPNWDHLIDITDLDPFPQIGWSYDGTTFSPPVEPEPDQPVPDPAPAP